MPFSQTAMAGGRIGEVNDTDHNEFENGTIVKGDDGHDYIFSTATGAIADAATCVLAEPALTMSAGAGDWTNNNGVALVANDRAWFQRTAI